MRGWIVLARSCCCCSCWGSCGWARWGSMVPEAPEPGSGRACPHPPLPEEALRAFEKGEGAQAGKEHPAGEARGGGLLELMKELLPLALEAAGCFRRRLRVDQLELKLTIGAADPGDAAIRYGQANALLGSIWAAPDRGVPCGGGAGSGGGDFTAAAPVLTGQVSLSLKLYQLLWLGLHFGLRALSIYVTIEIGINSERGGLNMEKQHPINEMMSTTMEKIRQHDGRQHHHWRPHPDRGGHPDPGFQAVLWFASGGATL